MRCAARVAVVARAPNRLRRGIKTGILGLSNVGKSSLFNALTENDAKAENFPFCTIDPTARPPHCLLPTPLPQVSRVAYPDARFEWLCE